jgi:hypothetical protein
MSAGSRFDTYGFGGWRGNSRAKNAPATAGKPFENHKGRGTPSWGLRYTTRLHRHAQGFANAFEISDTPANSGPSLATAARNPASSTPSFEYTTLPDASTSTK